MNIHFFKKILSVGIVAFSLMPTFGYAAIIRADMTDAQAGVTTPFTVVLSIHADNPINAVSGDIVLPAGLTPVDVDDADSIINFWVDHPRIDTGADSGGQKHIIFSGIIPGGFTGEGTLVVVHIKASAIGLYPLSFTPDQFKVYLHSSTPTEDAVSLEQSSIQVIAGDTVRGAENTSDTIPPEHFLMTVTKDQLVAQGKWIVAFATQDKQSGIKKYQIAEKRGEKVTDYSTLSWKDAESPYVLSDQRLQSYIYVQAIDNNGNVRVESVPPQFPVTWYDYLIFNLPVVLLLLLTIYFVGRYCIKKWNASLIHSKKI